MAAHYVAIDAEDELREATAKITNTIISDIEYVVDAPSPTRSKPGNRTTLVAGAGFRMLTRSPLVFGAELCFHHRYPAGALLLVTGNNTEADRRNREVARRLRQNKWLKLIDGKASDVIGRRRCRSCGKIDRTFSAQSQRTE